MAMISGLCAGKAIAGVLALGAASVVGYNWVTTGCPTGVCPTERAAQAAITPASLPTEAAATDACCALTAEAGAETKPASCATTAEACAATEQAGCCNADKAEQVAAAPVEVVPVAAPAAAEGDCCFDKGLPEPCSTEKACCQENYDLAGKTDAAPAQPVATP